MDKDNKKEKLKKTIRGLPVIQQFAAGADIGDTQHEIAINDGNGGHVVRSFKSFTEDLEQAVSWLKEEGITTLAMESTGVYYLNFYLLLEEAGIEPYLVNAHHVKNVTGRKKDDTDAIWIQRLHSCGLLQKCFQPDNDFRTLRTYVRQRKGLIKRSSDEVRRMQKALELMNIKVHTVISDILGKTGMQIIKAILAGQHDPVILSKLKDPRIKATEEEIIKSLQGIWKEEYIFLLNQSYNTYFFYQQQIRECETKIHEQLMKQVAQVNGGDVTEVSYSEKKGKLKKNQFYFTVSPLLKKITGVDLCKIPGISEVTALEFISETGIDTSCWKHSKRFSGWLNVAPNTKITGGKIISSKMMKKKNIAGQTLRVAASTLYRNKTPLGDYHRRMSFKYGGKGASLATAHKLSRIIFLMLDKKEEFSMAMLIDSQKKFKEMKIKQLERQLAKLKKIA
jgi:transposase